MAYDPNNSGSLGKNRNKAEGSQQPDYKGKITVDGVEYWLAGWVREKDGEKYISLRPEKKDAVIG
jgi:hypothetical protein